MRSSHRASFPSARAVRALLLGGAALLSPLAAAHAADEVVADIAASEDEDTRTSSEIVVNGEIGYRNRNEESEPVLIYGEDYFQRFEPLTAGDALKRVPSVTFLSDVLESDGARLRGLDPGYTQILINGDKVPGGNADRSFFLDRIPAELIKQVEIIRSSSARRTGDAVAGSLNIVLRDAFTMDGGYIRGGALRFDDGKVKPTGGVYYGGQVGPGRVLAGINVQGRYSPKKKQSLRFADSPENNPDFATDDFVDREDQSDVRNGTDYAGNLSYAIETDTTKFEIGGNYVRTDRTETERSFEYADITASGGSVGAATPGALLTDNANVNDIDQESYTLSGKLTQQWSLGETTLRVGYSRFKDRQRETEYQIDFGEIDDGDIVPFVEPEFEGTLTQTRITDQELSAGLDHEFKLGGGIDLVIGGFFQNKDRRTNIGTIDQGDDLDPATHAWDPFSDDPTEFAGDFDPLEPQDGGVNRIKEHRRDVFALVEGETGPVKWEAGVRWEHTRVRINDATVAPDAANTRIKYDELLPSASLKWEVGPGRITASVARTLRRPRFDYISPATLTEELGDNDLRGNPFLEPETSIGGDLGYEHRLGRTGVIGVNVFYRKIKNRVELVNTGLAGSEDDEDTVDEIEAFIYQPQNIGNGEVWGVEFDMSSSLAFLGMPETGIFGNFSMIDSSTRDEFGKRRFNDQSKYVYNFGFIQNLRDVAASFGATYRKQGAAFRRTVGEEVRTTYGADLEIFVEKRFGDSFTIRAVGSNLLNGKKRETFNKFDNAPDQVDRDFDEYELEAEEAGPVFQVVARYAF